MYSEPKSLIKAKPAMALLGYGLLFCLLFLSVMNFYRPFYAPNSLATAAPKLLPLVTFTHTDQMIEAKGSLIAHSDGHAITEVIFTLAGAQKMRPFQLNADTLTVSYQDHAQQVAHLAWTMRFQGDHNQDDRLDPGELVQLTVPLAGVLTQKVGPNTPFVIQVTPAYGAVLSLQAATPAELAPVMELDGR